MWGLELILTLLWALMLFSFFVQLFFWLGPFLRLATYSDDLQEKVRQKTDSPGVSVVICARNEAENLSINLSRILNQNYRSFEVVVVNDNSTDNTQEVLLDMQAKWSNLTVIQVTKSASKARKKKALEKGIRSTKYPLLAFTDADCLPESGQWLSSMVNKFEQQADVVLGYSPFLPKAGWLNSWIRFEGLWTAIQYLSAALWGEPYMGVGRNLAYRKNVIPNWDETPHYFEIDSGDDDLLVNAISGNAKSAISIAPSSFMWSIPKTTLKAYLRQKSRHIEASSYYQFKHQFWLVMLPGSMLIFHISILLLAAHNTGWWLMGIGLIWVLRSGVVGWIGGRLAKRMAQPDLQKRIIYLELLLPVYYLVMSLLFLSPKSWATWEENKNYK